MQAQSATHIMGGMNAGLTLVTNAGVPGDNTSGMLSRFETDILPYSPDLLILKGGTNDLSQGIDTLGTLSNIKKIKEKCDKNNIKLLLIIIPPRSDSYLVAAFKLREQIKMFASLNGITYSDPFSLAIDPLTGGYVSAYTSDNIHINHLGAILVSNILTNDILKKYYVLPLVRPNANILGNGLIPNPLFMTDTNADGYPDGYSYGVNGTPSLVTDSFFTGKAFKQTNPTGSVSVFSWNASIEAGDKLLITGKLKTDSTTASNISIYYNDSNNNRKYLVQGAGSQISLTLSIIVNAPASTTQAGLVIGCNAGTFNLMFGEYQIYNLSKLGLM